MCDAFKGAHEDSPQLWNAERGLSLLLPAQESWGNNAINAWGFACVFVLHRMFTQNTPGPLRMRSAHPSNLLGRQRHSVPQNNMSPQVTLWPHRGSCCQLCLAKAQHCVLPNALLTEASAYSFQTVRPQVIPSKASPSKRTVSRLRCGYTLSEGQSNGYTLTSSLAVRWTRC